MRKYKVAICRFPGSAWEHADCTSWLMATLHEMKMDQRIESVVSKVITDTPITMTRNRAVKWARALGIDYILMIDSDMAPDYLVGQDVLALPFWSTAWEFMMERREEEERLAARLGGDVYGGLYTDEDIDRELLRKFPPATIAAPYCGPPPDECCYVFHWRGYESGAPLEKFKLEMIPRDDAARRSGIQEVAALPTGLILYDTRVFSELPPPWFRYEWQDVEESDKASTEDVYQTRNASMLGLPQYCLWDSWAVHWKPKAVRKPSVLTKDMVHDSLVQAVGRGYMKNEKLHFQRRPTLVSIDANDVVTPWPPWFCATTRHQDDRRLATEQPVGTFGLDANKKRREPLSGLRRFLRAMRKMASHG